MFGGTTQSGPQSSAANDKQNQFNQDCTDLLRIDIFDSQGKPLHKSVLSEIKVRMDEFILDNINIPDISSVFDFSVQRLKFSPSNFTDITLHKYINYLEANFLLKRDNQIDTRYLIAFACFQGPVSFFIKKVMANFDFKTPFNVVETPLNSYLNANASSGLGEAGCSEFIMSNGAQ